MKRIIDTWRSGAEEVKCVTDIIDEQSYQERIEGNSQMACAGWALVRSEEEIVTERPAVRTR